LEQECNDVAVCRVWSYGRSSMVRKFPTARRGMSWYCKHAILPVVGDAVKAGGRQTVRHVAHDSEWVGHFVSKTNFHTIQNNTMNTALHD